MDTTRTPPARTTPLLVTYRVTIETPKGVFDVDLKTAQGADAAGRRAWMSLVQARHGDVDEVIVIGTAVVCGWFAGCENVATGETDHPILGNVPTCDTCAAFAAR